MILVFDITTHSSFRGLDRWREEALSHAEKDAVVTLVGNKTDVKHLRTVTRVEAQKYAEQQNINFIESSAADASNVELAFETIIKEMYNAAIFREDNSETLHKEQQQISITQKETKLKVPRATCC